MASAMARKRFPHLLLSLTEGKQRLEVPSARLWYRP